MKWESQEAPQSHIRNNMEAKVLGDFVPMRAVAGAIIFAEAIAKFCFTTRPTMLFECDADRASCAVEPHPQILLRDTHIIRNFIARFFQKIDAPQYLGVLWP